MPDRGGDVAADRVGLASPARAASSNRVCASSNGGPRPVTDAPGLVDRLVLPLFLLAAQVERRLRAEA